MGKRARDAAGGAESGVIHEEALEARRKKWRRWDSGAAAMRRALAQFAAAVPDPEAAIATMLGAGLARAAGRLSLPPDTRVTGLRVWTSQHVFPYTTTSTTLLAEAPGDPAVLSALGDALAKAGENMRPVYGRPATPSEIAYALDLVANGAYPESALFGPDLRRTFEVLRESRGGVAPVEATLKALAAALGAQEHVFLDETDARRRARVAHVAVTVDERRHVLRCDADAGDDADLFRDACGAVAEGVVDAIGAPRSLEWAARAVEGAVNARRERFAPWLHDLVLFTSPPLPMSRLMAHFAVHPVHGRSTDGEPGLRARLFDAPADEVTVTFQRHPIGSTLVRKADLRWVERVFHDNGSPPEA